jgi:hypothetical protein
MVDLLEAEITAGTIRALRRRAELQRKRAADWTVTTESGARIVAGEGRIAERLATALDAVADEFERCPSSIAAI